MEELKKLEDAIKKPNRTQDDIIKYLLASKDEMKEDSKRFFKSDKFQEIRKKVKELNKK